MAAKIKLQRKGTKNKPFYRVVVQDESAAPSSNVIEILGQYDPLKDPIVFNVDQEKIKAWLAKGAEPTEKVRILLGKAGILPPVDLSALKKKKPKAQLKAEAEAKPEGEAKPAEGAAEGAAPAAEEPKKEEPKAEIPKVEEKKPEPPKAEAPKAEEPKKEEPPK